MWWPWKRKRPEPQFFYEPVSDEWITVPFRYAEAARLTVYTIAQEKQIPAEVRRWIMLWLDSYNSHLIHYMRHHYGPNVFPLLDEITSEVMPSQEADRSDDTQPLPIAVDQETWLRWEQELQGGNGE